MDVLNGLTFEEARKRVTKSFRESVQNSSVLSDDQFSFDAFNPDGFSHASSIPTAVVILAFAVALILVKFQHADLLLVVIIVTIVMLLNFIIVALYRQSEKRELAKSLHDILSAYESSCERMNLPANETGSPLLTEPLLPAAPVLTQDDFKSKTYLSSGHSHVSIVHTYRDGQWMRLPVLLLAEGDIIALMGGDLTPAKCHEIERVNGTVNTTTNNTNTTTNTTTNNTTTNNTTTNNNNNNMPPSTEDSQFDDTETNLGKNQTIWVIGRLMNAGEKVHIRNRQQFSQQKPVQHHQGSPHSDEPVEEVIGQQPLHYGERHRSLAAESVEILGLCGDVRCFRLAETPIVSFLQSTTEPNHVSYNTHPISGLEGAAAYSVVHTTATEEGNSQTPSLIRTIFYTIVVQEGYKAFVVVSVLTALACITRALLVNESSLGANNYHNLSYDDWVTSILIPTATSCVFFLPLALPIALILAEALATADVLASAEVTLRPVVSVPKVQQSASDRINSNMYDAVEQDTNPLLGSTSGGVNHNNSKNNKRKGSKEADVAHGRDGSDDGDAEMEDEFMDEDIDERAEDIAEGISTQVRWSRYLGYLARVLWHRLLLGMYPSCHRSTCACCASGAKCVCAGSSGGGGSGGGGGGSGSLGSESYLPIPLARSRLLEVLGAVTMVCFVDDDVICEGYSVTEEIFLLMDNPQLGDTAHPSQKHKLSAASHTDHTATTNKAKSTDEGDAVKNSTATNTTTLDQHTDKQLTTPAVKGIVLDLHANPEATGSRFENPQWWRYLPSLKPLGLNAMLTYAYTATSSIQHEALQQRQASGGGDSSGHGNSYGTGNGNVTSAGNGNGNGGGGGGSAHGHNVGRTRSNTSHLPYPPAIQHHHHNQDRTVSTNSDGDHSPTHHTTHLNTTHLNNTHLNTTHQNQTTTQHQQTERSLVRHIRHLLPLESLRELAEEIGFEQSDLSAFSRVLEVNVLAPGLENAHLLEDTHQWGQEESRRRGSLLPQLRGGVYKDFRDGSLQMMSLGDPSLVLNYCREYWDGSTRSITPLSSTDRAEVLNVYERWRLEDFEVVAFCYSPVPTGGLQPLLSKEDAHSQATVANFTRHASASVSAVGHGSGGNGSGSGNGSGGNNGSSGHSSRAVHQAALGYHTGSFSLGATGRAPSIAAAPFIPAKHNTLFFVDPITTQDLHRIAAGITSKSKNGALKANTRLNSVQHHHPHVQPHQQHHHEDSAELEHEPADHSAVAENAHMGVGEHKLKQGETQDKYDFYPEHSHAEPLSVGSSAFGTAKTGPSTPSADQLLPINGPPIVRAASFSNSPDSNRAGMLEEKNRRSGEASPVKNPLRAQDDSIVTTTHTPTHTQQSPPQTRPKSTSSGNQAPLPSPPPAPVQQQTESIAQAQHSPPRALRGTSDPFDNATGRKTSRSDASYMTPSTNLCASKGGHIITKSMSLDRVNEYNFDRTHEHVHDANDDVGFCHTKRADEDDSLSVSDAESLLMPLPGALKASTSDRDVRVKEHGGKEKVTVITKHSRVNSATHQPRSPVLLFPDEDDTSSVASSLASGLPVGIGSAEITGSSNFGRAATVETSNPTRSYTGIGVRFGSDSDDSPTDLGLNLDADGTAGASGTTGTDSAGAGSALTRSRTFHVNMPASTLPMDKSSSGSGSLTPPLVPRQHFPMAKNTAPASAHLSPQLRHHASEYVQQPPLTRHHHRHGPHSALYNQLTTHTTSRQRQAQQVQRSHQQSRQLRRASTRQLWTQMRQQVFLGMAASSVPVRKDVPNTKEDLDSAGVRFVYFSAQNMKRSKPVAEKIGIPFDWNCAISLRELEGDTAQDPHRHISNYADWDVLAHMPHGIEAIKSHIQNVDNVPLLVSLFTDATPLSVRQMVEVFRDNGEVVLTIGGGYRSKNHAIYASSDVACSVSVLPGLGSTSTLPASEKELIEQFPLMSDCSLCQADVLLSFRLIGLTTINLLQTPFRDDLSQCNGHRGCACQCRSRHAGYSSQAGMSGEDTEQPYVIDMHNAMNNPSKGTATGMLRNGENEQGHAEHLRLSVLLEVIRKGRILLRNMHQALALFCVATLSLSAWPLVSLVVPLSLPPSPPPGLALLFQLIYVPALCLTLLQCGEPEGVMKNTPRKNQLLQRPRDVARFCWYLALRSGYVLFSIAVIGWLATASTMKSNDASFGESMWTFYYLRSSSDADLRALWLVQDLMSAQALLSVLSQALTLLVRGQTELAHFPWPWRLPEAYFYVSSAVILLLHAAVLAIREEYRRLHFNAGGAHSYAALDWFVWFALFLLPVLGVVLGVLVNRDDQHHYKRYLQFLRLEFDTRLGMHSPR